MNRNGFVFVETIVVIVVLTSALLLIYSSFNNVLQSEKTRVDYDNIAYVYRTQYVKNILNNLNFRTYTKELDNNVNKYFVTVGIESNELFLNHDNFKNYFNNLLRDFGVKQLVVIKKNKIEKLKNCTEKCLKDNNCKDSKICNEWYLEMDDDMLNYIKTLYIDVKCINILIAEFETCQNNNCNKFYGWVSI